MSTQSAHRARRIRGRVFILYAKEGTVGDYSYPAQLLSMLDKERMALNLLFL